MRVEQSSAPSAENSNILGEIELLLKKEKEKFFDASKNTKWRNNNIFKQSFSTKLRLKLNYNTKAENEQKVVAADRI